MNQHSPIRHGQTLRCQALLLLALTWALIVQAQAPTGYYSAAKGKKAAALKTALGAIVGPHTERSYNQLWQDFKTTDVRPDGTIWDIYSNATSYRPGGSAQGANYRKEGDSYNREHSFPKSWFNDAKPMYTDLFHLYPTDGYVNNRRSNYPYGETKGERYMSADGFSKLGSCTVPGYTGIVFEPADEYKGDLARTYFYMATAYDNKIAGWHSDMLAGNSYPAFSSWALTMLLRWAAEDPVSDKERARNEAVYNIQHNRNPYIDYPGLEQYVWGEKTTTAFDPDNYTGGTTEPTEKVVVPTVNPESGIVTVGTTVTITTPTEGATIHYTLVDGSSQTISEGEGASPLEVTITTLPAKLSAYATKGTKQSETITASYREQAQPGDGELPETYNLLTQTGQLEDGLTVVIAYPAKSVAMSEQLESCRFYGPVSITDNGQELKLPQTETTPAHTFTLSESAAKAWTFLDDTDGSYLALTKSDNALHSASDPTEETAQWTISFNADGNAEITSVAYPDRSICYNVSSPRFAAYKASSKQKPVALYGGKRTATGLTNVTRDGQTTQAVYDFTGRRVATLQNGSTATERSLPAGLYIVGGRKVLIK